ncbi:hypothetical protein ASPWEDRAFT_58602 [Aspergillus wentii DTO 134E9]|uniref:YTH domain-containing protein n=1 Tax=Aspergillus wentii DTO 134E9 TaxID=1073089 RepID=A0A1L9RPP4_ASPWE|nr:uncharacterized protein ASPWEDRAFT_58602 [Aspergillus wentii DTO 134E9]OJJ36798.1 hypothetical protein ASPWEDRAFT_58602 [Aspergillus wentii DTO 134E9]
MSTDSGPMDDVSSGQPRSRRGASEEINLSSKQPQGSAKPQQSSGPKPAPQSSKSDDAFDHYSKSHTFVAQGSHGQAPSVMSMTNMTSSLPSYQSQTHLDHHPIQHHFYPGAQTHGIMYPIHPMPPYHGAPPGGTAYSASFSQVYPPYMHHPQHTPTVHHGASVYHSFMPNPSAHHGAIVPNQTTAYSQTYYSQHTYPAALGHGQTAINMHFYSQPGPRNPKTQPPPATASAHTRKGGGKSVPSLVYDVSKTIVDGSIPMKPAPAHSPTLATPRGPPRKPKQSGHALWVGNLPPGANVVDLKDHFSRDATSAIESVFLISKSNCAFINYKTEAACAAALARFNDSKFQGVRLVCRLRRGLIPGSNQNTLSSSTPYTPKGEENPKTPIGNGEPPGTLETRNLENKTPGSSRVPNRYFVVKSLTMEDLELSRQSGIWATQNHNEANLNQAFETADNVYLIFSANKSGEYYGYARMLSPIIEDEALALEMPPRLDPVITEELNVTQTQATSTAPSGRIIDDSARGTIFWEADSEEEDEEEDDDDKSEKSVGEPVEESTEPGSQSIGNPFRIQWLSTGRVPFHRTRGLRNPWNANREVKIARDGTEIEPTAGAKLLQLFQPQPSGFQTP